MAEFAELMKQARRMCGSISCDNCILPRSSDEMCIWEDAPARLTDEVIAEIEAKTLKWAAENPELRYPTWREWQQEHFPDADGWMRPCNFISFQDAGCMNHSSCQRCAEWHIPADIAQKLGIQPIPAEPQETLVDEYERLRDRVENLNLYLGYVQKEYPTTYKELVKKFSGLPGFERVEG